MDLSHIVHGLKPARERRVNSSANSRSHSLSPQAAQPPSSSSSSSSSAHGPAQSGAVPVQPLLNNQMRRSVSNSRSLSDHAPAEAAPNAVGSSSGKVLACDKCGRTFSSRKQFDQHISVFHARSKVPSRQREANFLCAYCGKKFTSPSKRTLHVNATHMGLKPHQCEICSKSFGYKGGMSIAAAHLHAHPILTTTIRFPSRKHRPACTDLAKHMASHSGEKPYSCYICGAKFARNFYVKRHIETIHEKKGASNSL